MPSTKVSTAAVASAIVTVITWLLAVTTGVDVDAAIAAAVTTAIAFGLSYFVPETNPAPSAVQTLRRRGIEPVPMAGDINVVAEPDEPL